MTFLWDSHFSSEKENKNTSTENENLERNDKIKIQKQNKNVSNPVGAAVGPFVSLFSKWKGQNKKPKREETETFIYTLWSIVDHPCKIFVTICLLESFGKILFLLKKIIIVKYWGGGEERERDCKEIWVGGRLWWLEQLHLHVD